MQKLILSSAIVLLMACTQPTKTNSEAQNHSTTPTASEAAVETKTTENPTGTYVGTWTCDAAVCGVDIQLHMRDDSTFTQLMGTHSQEGTWMILQNGRLSIKTPGLKNGQEWETKNISASVWELCWNPDAKDPKTIALQKSN